MNKKKIINDPLYGFITLHSEHIFDILSHPYFQRLRHIKQLGLTDYVYPGALHTRLSAGTDVPRGVRPCSRMGSGLVILDYGIWSVRVCFNHLSVAYLHRGSKNGRYGGERHRPNEMVEHHVG